MSDEQRDPVTPDDDEPRKGFFDSIPRGTIPRVVILLAALAGIIILQRKTGAIAGCMNQAFLAPAPARVQPAPGRTDAGTIRARVLLPGTEAGQGR